MSKRIREFFAPPVFEDEEKTRIAGLLNTILLALLAIAVISNTALGITSSRPLLALGITSTIILLATGLLFLARLGYIQLASILLTSAIWTLVTFDTFFTGGMRGPAFSAYVLVILIAGLLLGGRAGIIFAGASFVIGIVVLYGETSQVLPLSPPTPLRPIFIWLLQNVYLIFFAILLHLAFRSLTDALKRARDNEHKLIIEVAERKRAEDQIKISLREKEVLLQEIHHRVKNNLQVVSSLLNLQAGYIEDPQALEIFKESQHRVRSMALIHEKLYRSEGLARIDFAEYIRDLSAYLLRSQNAHGRGIGLNIEADDVFLAIDKAVPCGLILNELVSNSLKHAFPNGQTGEIRIELRTDQKQQLILKVGDSGIGFPEDIDFCNTTSLGLQLVNTLVNQLDGTIELSRNNGTEFKIRFSAS
jgi:two-component sensor histidine kinase